MGYRKIPNLYKNTDILYFKQAYALEKCHGTSSHIKYRASEDRLTFFSGYSKHDEFLELFDQGKLLELFRQNYIEYPGSNEIVIYGEAYGSLHGMSDTYGKDLKFIAFEVNIDGQWLSVPQAEKIATKFGQEFVPYEIIDITEDAINAAMMKDSEIAIRRGCGQGKIREGIVLRPLIEVGYANGGRIICKHRRPEFAERKNTPKFSDPERLKILEDAREIADEWVVGQRLIHVLDAIGITKPTVEDIGKIIRGMIADVFTEAKGEIVESKEVRKAIGRKTVKLLKQFLI
jgi:hypothetical protein